MKRVLLAGILATLMTIAGSVSAGTGSVTCGQPLSAHNAAPCSASGLTWSEGDVASVSVKVGIGPLADIFHGDVQVTLANAATMDAATAFVSSFCGYRPTNLFAGTCVPSADGQFTPGEPLFCLGKGSGVGQWDVTCSIQGAA